MLLDISIATLKIYPSLNTCHSCSCQGQPINSHYHYAEDESMAHSTHHLSSILQSTIIDPSQQIWQSWHKFQIDLLWTRKNLKAKRFIHTLKPTELSASEHDKPEENNNINSINKREMATQIVHSSKLSGLHHLSSHLEKIKKWTQDTANKEGTKPKQASSGLLSLHGFKQLKLWFESALIRDEYGLTRHGKRSCQQMRQNDDNIDILTEWKRFVLKSFWRDMDQAILLIISTLDVFAVWVKGGMKWIGLRWGCSGVARYLWKLLMEYIWMFFFETVSWSRSVVSWPTASFCQCFDCFVDKCTDHTHTIQLSNKSSFQISFQLIACWQHNNCLWFGMIINSNEVQCTARSNSSHTIVHVLIQRLMDLQ